MNKPVKLPEIRKAAFINARESLGLSTKDLAGMACLSVRQIEQIENGDSGSFYGPQVKVTAAKKVAGLLKLKEEDAFDFGEVAASKADSKNVVEETTSTETKSVANQKAEKKPGPAGKAEVKKQVTQVLKEDIQQAPVTPVSVAKMHSTDSAKSKNKKRFVFIGIAAALIFSIVNLRPLFFPEVVKEEVVVAQEAVPASAPVELVSDSKPASEVASPVAAVVPVISSDCPPADSAAVSYKPDAPKKAGDMVYLQTKTAQTVCIVDANGKTQNKTLEPGVGASIYGKPPLKVLTSGQTPVDLFYQGVKVRLSNTTAKTIILEPAELTQPAAPTDSQFR